MDFPADVEMEAEDVQYGMIMEEGDFEETPEEYIPRQRNLGQVQHRKFTGYDQNLPMVIYGYREQTVHGTSANGNPQTLIVLRWGLQQRKRGRRFKSATLRAVFATQRTKDGGRPDPYYDPDVIAVEPNGTYSLLPTPVTIERTRNVETGFEGGMDFAKGTLKLAYELSTSATGVDQISINGATRNEYDYKTMDAVGDPDRCNVAEWRMYENTATSSGLPTFFRTAVLVERRRRDTGRFTATFTIRAEVDDITDAWSGVKRFIGLTPKDDPIIFDPSVEEGGPLTEYKHRLDPSLLYDLCKIVMFKTTPGSNSKAAQGTGVDGESSEAKDKEKSDKDSEKGVHVNVELML
ncbi:hypothetical protein ABW21_db0209613 [Orbilia brochopaga]|nr:hypothetical protein ABW21_db0209613 [Drechslerella brochopaga]